jgi:hypothetical protein
MKQYLLFAFILFVSPIFVLGQGQGTSGVTGVVHDANGAIVAGAKVTLTDTKTGRELNTTSNDQGTYIFSNVQPGEKYRLTFSNSGFKTTVLDNVTLGVGRTETYDTALVAGDVSATVDVVASGQGDTLNTTDASIGNVIDQRQLRELPIQIRNSPAALIGLQPGVVGNNVGTGSSNRVGSVTGSRADQGNITVDGIDANDQATGQFAATVGNAPIDSIQEFRAVSTNPQATSGRSAGGEVELVTKSGTNQFHGSLREYNRNDKFAANSFFNNRSGVARPKLNRNQFGGSLGGPLPMLNFGEHDPGDPFFRSGKNKLFFFFDYEGRREATGVSYLRIVPLNHVRQGGLAYINNTPGCTFQSRLNTTPQCITILTPAQIAALDPQHVGVNQALLNYTNGRYPMANDLTAGDGINTGGFRFNAPAHRQDDTYTTRFDANITDKNKVFFRFNIAHRNQTDTVNTVAAQFPGDPEPSQIVVRDWAIAGGWTWVATNNFLNQLTIGNSHSGLDFPALFAPAFPQVWTFGNSSSLGSLLSAPYAGISSQNRNVDTPTIRDDATWTMGSHTFTFGGSFKPIRSLSGLVNDFNFVTLGLGGLNNSLTSSLRPSTILATSATATRNYDRAFTYALGRIASISTNFNYSPTGEAFAPGTGKSRDYRYNELEFYGQDNWKIRNSLTVNLGLRWQYYQPPYEANGFQAAQNVDISQLFPIRVANGAAGTGGDSAEPFLTYDLIGKANNGRPLYKPDRNNFSPRLGFAWSPKFDNGIGKTLFGDRKTSIRGGASVLYERVAGALTFIQDQVTYLFDNSANTNFGAPTATQALLNDPRFTSITAIPIQNVAPSVARPNTPFVDNGVPFGNAEGQTNYTISENFQTPYYYQYSIGVQRELPKNMLLDVSYVGRLGRKLFTQADAAQIVDFKDPASGQTLLQALNNIQSALNAGTAVPTQAFLENQGALALGVPCGAVGIGTCTAFTAANLGSLISIGDASDTVQALNSFGLLRNNVGLSGQFSTNAYISNLGHSRYDGLLVSLQKRFSHGFQFDVNYTYSFSKDNNSSVANTVFGGLICDLRDLNACYGPSDFDIRHLFNADWVWELPFGKHGWIGRDVSGWANEIIGGWQVSGIVTARSGLPFSTSTGAFPVGFVFDSPAVFNGNASNLHGTINTSGQNITYFGGDAASLGFTNPQNGQIGVRNNLRGPRFWNVDLGIAKNFALPWEGQRLQIRADAFNAFNDNFFSLPNANINSTSFGQITSSASAPREIQFAIRWDF